MVLKLENFKSVDRHKQAYETVVNSPKFNKWFEDSKIVDADGNPQVFYHGTYSSIDIFNPKIGQLGNHFGTLNAAHAKVDKYHTSMPEPYFDDGSKVYPVLVNIKNPLRIGDVFHFGDRTMLLPELLRSSQLTEEQKKMFSIETSPVRIKELLMSFGFDGIQYENKYESPGEVSVITFTEKQVWSLYANVPM